MAYLTLLEVINQFSQRTLGKTVTSVLSSTDPQIVQMKALLQEGLEDTSQRGAWEALVNEASWATLAAESQGAITTLATNGWNGYFMPETLWDRTEKLPLLGPTSAKDWQFLKAIVVTGPRYSFRLRQDLFIVTPAPPAGHTWVFEYVSKNFVKTALNVYQNTFTLDTDTILLPENIVKADLRWRWKKEKGLPYAEDFNSFERLCNNALGRDGGKKVLKLDAPEGGYSGPKPGIFVPAGSWHV